MVWSQLFIQPLRKVSGFYYICTKPEFNTPYQQSAQWISYAT